ncbi:MAG: hypothetical protein Q4C66_17070 [Lachnospiraceae bacterium]|nr:hypothetical protein [Lachnospiraceae bacterium]
MNNRERYDLDTAAAWIRGHAGRTGSPPLGRELLEHIPEVEQAVKAAVNMAKQYVVVTVPSKPDNNSTSTC